MKMSSAPVRLATCCLALLFGAGLAGAQTIYRIVGPDGKITFSDKPPTEVSKVTATSAGGKPGAVGGESVLPYELRQAVSRYPVTLYAAGACAPCDSGRQMLQGRGVPFTEYSVSSPDDSEALQRLSGTNSVPFLTIGGQKLKGYSEAEWSQFLSAANYPASSVLPPNYRNPPPRALVVVQKPTPPKPEEGQARIEEKPNGASAPAETPSAEPANPIGIRF